MEIFATRCNMGGHEGRHATTHYVYDFMREKLAGAGRFEPPNGGIKIRFTSSRLTRRVGNRRLRGGGQCAGLLLKIGCGDRFEPVTFRL